MSDILRWSATVGGVQVLSTTKGTVRFADAAAVAEFVWSQPAYAGAVVTVRALTTMGLVTTTHRPARAAA